LPPIPVTSPTELFDALANPDALVIVLQVPDSGGSYQMPSPITLNRSVVLTGEQGATLTHAGDADLGAPLINIVEPMSGPQTPIAVVLENLIVTRSRYSAVSIRSPENTTTNNIAVTIRNTTISYSGFWEPPTAAHCSNTSHELYSECEFHSIAAEQGGGIMASGNIDLTLDTVTLSYNRASDEGGGMYYRGFLSTNRLWLIDTEIASNRVDGNVTYPPGDGGEASSWDSRYLEPYRIKIHREGDYDSMTDYITTRGPLGGGLFVANGTVYMERARLHDNVIVIPSDIDTTQLLHQRVVDGANQMYIVPSFTDTDYPGIETYGTYTVVTSVAYRFPLVPGYYLTNTACTQPNRMRCIAPYATTMGTDIGKCQAAQTACMVVVGDSDRYITATDAAYDEQVVQAATRNQGPTNYRRPSDQTVVPNTACTSRRSEVILSTRATPKERTSITISGVSSREPNTAHALGPARLRRLHLGPARVLVPFLGVLGSPAHVPMSAWGVQTALHPARVQSAAREAPSATRSATTMSTTTAAKRTRATSLTWPPCRSSSPSTPTLS
jgi:hypothetical protein